MKATVKRIPWPSRGRVLAVSDIHGNLPFLKGALDKAGFSDEDTLILLGDLVEKGTDSLGCLRYGMELARTHTVHFVRGNCDDIILDFMDRQKASDRFFNHFFSLFRGRCLLGQMAAELGLELGGPETYPAIRTAVGEAFGPELDYLRSSVTILELPGYHFVHGGIPRETELEELDAWKCMKNDDFLHQGHRFRDWCVVGHWPVTLYWERIPSAAPYIDREQRIVSIDGGCVLKVDGQVNVLILPGGGGEDFRWVSYDGMPRAVALEDQTPSADSLNIRYGHSELELLQSGEEFSLCRHVETGRELEILSEYLYRGKDGALHCEDSTDYRLGVKAGERLSVVRVTSRGVLAKKAGATGWYFGKIQPISEENFKEEHKND